MNWAQYSSFEALGTLGWSPPKRYTIHIYMYTVYYICNLCAS